MVIIPAETATAQDPYHDVGQAEGLAFSVPRGQKVPSSLQNIYKELRTDVGAAPPPHGHLGHWVQQGVLLLNTSLSVEVCSVTSISATSWCMTINKMLLECFHPINISLDT